MRNSRILIKRVAIALSALLLVSAVGFAQVTVSLPTVTARVGATQAIPITVGDLTGKGVISFQFTVKFDTTIVKITGISATGTLASSLQVSAPNTSVGGQISVAAAGLSALSGSGTLLILNATMVGKGSSALHFDNFSFNEGNPAATLTHGSVIVPSLSVSATNTTVTALPGAAITVPIATEDVTGKGVIAYQFTVKFDQTKINLTGVSATGTLSSSMQVSAPNTSVAGQITVAAAGLAPLSGAGVLINLTGTVVAAGTSNVQFSSFQFNEGNPAAAGVDGIVTVNSSTNRPPAFTAKLTDQAVSQGSTLTFTYVAVDPDAGNTVTYTLLTGPAGATLTSGGVFSFTPVAASPRTNPVVVVASDGTLADTAKATITVNHKPVFVSKLPGTLTTASQNNNVAFSVKASDVDGGVLQYTWKLNGAIVKGPSADSTYTVRFTDPHGTAKSVMAIFKTAAGLADSTSAVWNFTITPVGNDPYGIPTEFAVGQNYPNPFNPTTTIRFDLPKEAPVTMEVYNVLGVRIRTLLKGENIAAGHHQMVWDGRDDNGNVAPSGVYLYRISANDFHGSKKMTLVK